MPAVGALPCIALQLVVAAGTVTYATFPVLVGVSTVIGRTFVGSYQTLACLVVNGKPVK